MAEPYRGILGPVLGQVEAIKSARSNRAMDELQAKYLQQGFEARQQQQTQQTEAEQNRADAEYAANIFGAVAQSQNKRDAAQRLVVSNPRFQEISKRLQLGDFSRVDDMTDEQIASGAMDNFRALGGALQQQEQPAGIQEFDYLTKIAAEDSERGQAARVKLGTEGRAGQGQMVMLGNVPHYKVDTPEGVQFIPASTLQQEATGKATVAGAEASAKVEGTAAAEDLTLAPKRLAAANATISDVENNLLPAFDKVASQASGWTVGLMSMAQVPGSPAADLQANLTQILGSAAFDRLQEMRNNSPTGGALGSITEREIDLLASTRAALQASQSPEQFKENLARLRAHYGRVVELAKQSKQVDQLKTQLVQLQRRPAGAERDSRLQRVQERIATIEDQWWDSLEQGGPDEAAPGAAPGGAPPPTATPATNRVKVDWEGNEIAGP